MPTWIRKLLAVPVFEDKDKTRIAGLLNTILLTIFVVAVVIPPILVLIDPAGSVFTLLICAVAAAMASSLLLLIRRGHVQMASVLLSSLLLVIVTVTIYIFGGVHNFTGYFLVIIIAALLLGERAAISFGLLCLLATVGMFYAQISGATVPPMQTPVGFPNLIVLTTFLGLSALMLHFAVRSIAEGFERARRSEERYRQLVELSPDMIAVQSEGKVVFVNAAGAKLFGAAHPDQLIGKPIMDFVHPGYQKIVKMRVQQIQEEGKKAELIEEKFVRLDGQVIDVEAAGIATTYQGKPAIQVVARDITERKRAEEAEREQRALAEALRDTAEVLNSTLDIDKVLDHILANIGRVVPHDAVNIHLLDENAETGRVFRIQGYDERNLGTPALERPYRLVDVPIFCQLVESKQPIVIPDTQANPDWVTFPETSWVRSYASAPMCLHGDVIGFLNLDSATPGFFTATHAKQLQAFANQAAYAIQNARLYARLEEYSQALEKKVEKRTETLRESEETARALLNAPIESAILIDTGGTILALNETAAQRLGKSVDALVGLCLYDFFSPAVAQSRKARIDEAIRSSEPVRFEDERKGRSFDSSIYPVFDAQGEVARVAVFGRDISERKQAEEALRASEEKFRQFFENEPEYCYMVSPEGAILDVNHAALKALGYRKEEIVGKPLKMVYASESLPKMEQLFARWKKTGRFRDEEMVIITKRGDRRTVLLSASVVKDRDGKILHSVSVQRDITERKRVEEALRESEAELFAIFDNAPIVMILVDRERRVRKVNRGTLEFTSRPAEEMIGLRGGEALRCLHSLDDSRGCGFGPSCEMCRVRNTVLDTFETGKSHHRVEANLPFARGEKQEELTFLVSTTLLSVPKEQMVLVCIEDITERKQVEKQLQTSLREKEVLLREIHHRVKNNLQVVSSLLSLQADYVEDGQAIEMLRESQNRVRFMALVHEKLYRSRDLARVDFAEYIRNLTAHLFRSYRVRGRGITLKMEVSDIALGIDAAVPCGLIVNELMSNALKHAFPNGREGEICVSLSSDQAKFTLTVGDNGVGFPTDLDFRNTGSLGLQLVVTLVEQLDGSIELNRNNGTTFKIEFPEQV